MRADERGDAIADLDVVVVGAGFSGLHALHRMRGLGLATRVFEAGGGVGGTWFWNRYPGARCDVESWDYSYSFDPELDQEWEWSERYPAQPEIRAYLDHVADRYRLRDGITLDTRVTSAHFDDGTGLWRVRTDRGHDVTARYVVMATGCLSAARIPDFRGAERFRGRTYHTGQWPEDGVDFRGSHVAVIGTGSSGVQAIPLIAEQATSVTVFQRTATFSVPARNRALSPQEQRRIKETYPERRRLTRDSPTGTTVVRGDRSAIEVSPEERRVAFEQRWEHGGSGLPAAFDDVLLNPRSNDAAAEFVRSKIREIVEDPQVAERLCPQGVPIGAKRLCVDTGYYATYNAEHVELVDVRENPIEEITAEAVRTSARTHPCDAIVFATGYDAMTGALARIDIRGRNGLSLREKWSAGPVTYLGLATAGFPNLFVVAGPGSPSVLTNVVVSIEHHVEWLGELLTRVESGGIRHVEATEEAEARWVEHVNELAVRTLYPQANSWYLGANVPGKPQVFMPYPGGLVAYRETCARVAERDYEGFTLTPAPVGRTCADSAAPLKEALPTTAGGERGGTR
ncbi:NAD(P)/FAD-dependent oxidoreductase [Saccharopolyspora karakumensis]|uniref:NAD(P)/FAD-dependent oxidoreductase n=1 Tax=Saccharopolyspora karakumensis TaxID=2530386 RepID=A0A4R5BY53_9PSEU|nr:NAD(P)/FAD-dependent oxidoreductase [Saccharopolyspora karakumensis]TDD90643.1 NAD(P)/FAD-dependent oxidoreductase [Saccharopolyspora karakumensis]